MSIVYTRRTLDCGCVDRFWGDGLHGHWTVMLLCTEHQGGRVPENRP